MSVALRVAALIRPRDLSCFSPIIWHIIPLVSKIRGCSDEALEVNALILETNLGRVKKLEFGEISAIIASLDILGLE